MSKVAKGKATSKGATTTARPLTYEGDRIDDIEATTWEAADELDAALVALAMEDMEGLRRALHAAKYALRAARENGVKPLFHFLRGFPVRETA